MEQDQNTQSEDGQYHVPDWAKHVVWYQIFPERFRNGDERNDPSRERAGGPEDWQISPWTGDWYERSDWEVSAGDTFKDGVYERRYGGDLQGIINKLDYIQDLGVGAIYLNPVFDAVSLHKYDTSCYRHIDRNFGPDPQGDVEIMQQEDPVDPSTWEWTAADRLFFELVEEVHQRDMRIIIDGVFNHTGRDFWAFRDLEEKQQDSAFKNWYSVNSFRDDDGSEFDYEGWWGFKELPEFRETDGNLAEPVKNHIFAITRRWMAPDDDRISADGIDGWRLDVPEEIGKNFWKEWNALVRDINPEAYTVGEIWTTKSIEWINAELFSAAMNYPFTEAVQNFMINRSVPASDFMRQLADLTQGLPNDAKFVQQNLMESHDTPRLASMVLNPGREFDSDTKPEEGFKVRKPNHHERRIQKLIALLQFTFVGAPMIFYGTEAGMWGADDPDDRKPMLWEEFDYAAEKKHPLGEDRPEDKNGFDPHLFNWYKKLAYIRNQTPALQTGTFKKLMTDDEHQTFAFMRALNEQSVCVTAFNRSEDSQKLVIPINDLNLSQDAHFENVLTNKRAKCKEQKVLLTLAPISGAILRVEG